MTGLPKTFKRIFSDSLKQKLASVVRVCGSSAELFHIGGGTQFYKCNSQNKNRWFLMSNLIFPRKFQKERTFLWRWWGACGHKTQKVWEKTEGSYICWTKKVTSAVFCATHTMLQFSSLVFHDHMNLELCSNHCPSRYKEAFEWDNFGLWYYKKSNFYFIFFRNW